MGTPPLQQTHILVVGPDRLALHLSELGAVVGLLGVSTRIVADDPDSDGLDAAQISTQISTQMRTQMAQFNALLPQYDLVVLADLPRGGLQNVSAMISAVKGAGKHVLVHPRPGDLLAYAGASLLIQRDAELEGIPGQWRMEGNPAKRMQALREQAGIESLLVTHQDGRMMLYTERQTTQFPMPESRGKRTRRSDTLTAILAALMAAGRSVGDAMAMLGGVVTGRQTPANVAPGELFA
ncbi:hypothetical protein BH11PSE11_BH11PSE11_35730 [soil metagenome]